MSRETASIAAGWWRTMQPYFADGTRNPLANRPALARLRRADLGAAMDDPATFQLFRALRCSRAKQLIEVALCAGVLATVRQDSAQPHAARALGPVTSGDAAKAAMSVLRFRRLMEVSEPEERLIALRRAVMLGGRTLRVTDLARACLDWADDRIRREWIFQYYNAASAIPDAPDGPPPPSAPSIEDATK